MVAEIKATNRHSPNRPKVIIRYNKLINSDRAKQPAGPVILTLAVS